MVELFALSLCTLALAASIPFQDLSANREAAGGARDKLLVRERGERRALIVILFFFFIPCIVRSM